MTVEVVYSVFFGKLDSEGGTWDVELTPEEENAYINAIKKGVPLDDVAELKPVLERAYKEIEEAEIESFLFIENEDVMECQGLIPVSASILNQLVRQRDAHAVEYLGLSEFSDEELSAWDAASLSNAPLVRNFFPDFQPISPFDDLWPLRVHFSEKDTESEDEYEDEEISD